MPPFETKNQIAIGIFAAPAAPIRQGQLRLFMPFFIHFGFFEFLLGFLAHDHLLGKSLSKSTPTLQKPVYPGVKSGAKNAE